MVMLALIILIWDEWPWPKFMLFAVAIGACGAFTTGLYVALVLLATKFPEELSEADGRTDSGQVLELLPGKVQQDHFTGTHRNAA
ncbi:MAG: hypothetical protein ACXVKH_05485 [Candidatus Angelobacter sp.]